MPKQLWGLVGKQKPGRQKLNQQFDSSMLDLKRNIKISPLLSKAKSKEGCGVEWLESWEDSGKSWRKRNHGQYIFHEKIIQ